ncbi:MAG: DUF2269 domain-containing protein [Actinomycetota bacterium]|nr:DUF2269 domain-containing protein [Actinomycetota bacterium]
MGIDGNLYQFIKVLHILAAIIGFGGMFIAGFYGQEAKKRSGREGLAVGETTLKVTALVPTMAIYSVPVLGILLIFFSNDAWKFSQAWISLSFLLYIVLLVLLIVVQAPATRRMVALQGEGAGTSTAEAEALNKKLAMVSGIINLCWIATLFLMVFKPGAPAGS